MHHDIHEELPDQHASAASARIDGMNSRLQTVNIARRPGLAVDTLISGRYGLWLENISRIPGCPEVCCELVPACFTPYIIGGRSWHLSDYSVENTPEF